MTRTMILWLPLSLVIVGCGQVVAQTDPGTVPASKQEIPAELSELRDRMATAFQARDVEALVEDLGPDVVITWQNNVRHVGVKDFRTFFQEMILGDRSMIADLKSTRQIESDAKLYGESTAVAWGVSKDDFSFRDGDELSLDSKWTATLVKTGEQWKVVSYHVSTDAFNNPIVATAKRNLITFASMGSVLGFLLGAGLMWFVMNSTRRLVSEL